MRELPTGTVTFLFTDVEGSTRLLQEFGDRYAEVLAEHRRVLRDAFARHGGVEVDTQGDAFFFAFAKASDALVAAAESCDALASGPVRVRMGLHTGEPVVTDEGYVGIDVHRAARIAAAGHGGQILVSQSTRDLIGDGLRDLGEHRLKDLTAPERIYQLGDEDFPPLKSLNTTNLPVAANPLVGRDREMRDAQALLRDSARLLTLTGAGGSGKTRLALQVAAELVESFSGGVFFVSLAGVARPEMVGSTIAETIGVRELTDLRDRNALVVVDNFEHVLEAAPAITELLASAPNTKVLATSRAPLRVEGEREYPIDPLPDDEAVELLTQRARAVRPDFVPNEDAAEICRRLDGLPLALELAASRFRSLSSDALLQRLDQRLPVLTGGRRDVPERQRTLRATIQWSHDLLPDRLKDVFAELGVFAGGFSLDAAEAVAGADLDDVDALVELSLLKSVGGARFLMLETIREFALAELSAIWAEGEVRRRHAQYFLDVARSANLMNESDGEQRHDIAIRDRRNFGAALDWTLAAGEFELGLQIAVALENYWATNAPEEWRLRLLPLFDGAPGTSGELRAQALRTLGAAAYIVGDYEEGMRRYEEALAEYRRLRDERGIGIMLLRLGVDARRVGDLERARSLFEESLELQRRVGFERGEAQALGALGGLKLAAGDEEEGLALFEQSVAVCERVGFTWWQAVMLLSLAFQLLERGRCDEAELHALRALPLIREMNDRLHACEALGLLASIAAETGRSERAGRLWGAAEAEEARAPLGGQWEEAREEFLPRVHAAAGAGFERARDEGRLLTLDEALEYAASSSLD